MVTRRGFISSGVAAACIGNVALGKPVRSALGGRDREGSSWSNPYVTDGLIAMWDGEWNAGGGVHDAAAATWKDLSGNGFDLTVDQGHVVWHENYVDPVDANAANHVYRENAQSEMAALGVAPVTVEAVFYNPYANGLRVLSCLTYQNRYNAFVGYYNTFGIGGALCDVPRGALLSCSASLTSTLVNGNDAGAVVYTNNVSGVGRAFNDISMFGVRNLNGDAGYPISCSLYTLRVYSGDLSTSDRIANYAVDKERFGLVL